MDENKTIDLKLKEMLNNVWDSLTDEQKNKVKACKTVDELAELAGKEGVELPNELLDAVAGGYVYWNSSDDIWEVIRDKNGEVLARFPWASSEDTAKAEARRLGQSDDEIGWNDLKKLRSFC